MSRYNLITCIIEKGKGKNLIKKALSSGAQAVTYTTGYGTGIREKIKAREISPQKEILFIVVEKNQCKKIFDLLIKEGKLKTPGKGFIFTQNVVNAVGFLK